MRLRVFTEPQQGSSYDQLLAVARCAEEEGYDAFFRSDHYLKMGGVGGLPGPTDAWTTLAGLARETDRVRLGTLLSSGTFRLPGPLAVTVAQVDAMSGGRVELGLGAGWYEDEHRAYGIPFPSTRERFDRLSEQLAVITGLWETPPGSTFSFSGRYYAVEGSPALPKPVQSPRPPVVVGGAGPNRTPALAAKFADEFNAPFHVPADAERQFRRVREACSEIGRDPRSLRYSVVAVICCGVDDASLSQRAAAIGRDVDELRRNGACGKPADVAARLSEWAAVGADTIYLQFLDLSDLDHIRLVGREVLPAVAQS